VHTTVEVLHVITLAFGALAIGGAVYETAVIFPVARARAGQDGPNLLRTFRLSPQTPAYRHLPASGLLSGLPATGAAVLWNHQPRSSAVLTAAGFVPDDPDAAGRHGAPLEPEHRAGGVLHRRLRPLRRRRRPRLTRATSC